MKKRVKNTIFGFSSKNDGDMRIYSDNILKNQRNRISFLKKETNSTDFVLAELAHKTNVYKVTKGDKNKIINQTDSLITNEKKINLALTAADCLIIFVYDPKKGSIAIIHAGWKGLINNIIIKTVQQLKINYQSESKDLKVYISPHIKKCHFEIKKDVLNKFKKYKEFIIYKKDKIFIDLFLIAISQLKAAKILNRNINYSNDCTYCCKNKYFSYRRDKLKNFKTMLGYIYLK